MNKEKLYEVLGASWFQKVVFKVEDLKFKFIDKFCPSIDSWYCNYCDKKVKKLCLKLENEEEKEKIRLKYNFKKMVFKKELREKKNRNYHIDFNNASKFKDYLLWNKKVHKNGMIWNGIWISLCSLALFFTGGIGSVLTYIWLGYNIVALGVNFECVNLQNYNLCRYEKREDTLVKIERRSRDRDVKNFAKVGEKIYNKLCGRIEIPKSSEVVSSITDKEELEQLRKLALEVKEQRQKNSRVLVKK